MKSDCSLLILQHTIAEDIDTNTLFFGVYDGHGGLPSNPLMNIKFETHHSILPFDFIDT